MADGIWQTKFGTSPLGQTIRSYVDEGYSPITSAKRAISDHQDWTKNPNVIDERQKQSLPVLDSYLKELPTKFKKTYDELTPQEQAYILALQKQQTSPIK